MTAPRAGPSPRIQSRGVSIYLGPADRNYVLRLARRALVSGEDPLNKVKGAEVPRALQRVTNLPVFVTLFRRDHSPVVAHSTVGCIAEGVVDAALAARRSPSLAQLNPDHAGTRIKVDLMHSTEPLDGVREGKANIVFGLEGVFLARGTARGYVLPGFPMRTGRMSVEDMLKEAGVRSGGNRLSWRRAQDAVFGRFRTLSFVEEDPGGPAVELRRAWPCDVRLDSDSLLDACLGAGQWLIRFQKPYGQFRYEYRPIRDWHTGRKYSITRHTAVAYSLYKLYGACRKEVVLKAADAATDYFLKRTIAASDQGPDAPLCIKYAHKVTTGPAALAALALLERRACTDDRQYDEVIQRLGRFLLLAQTEAGDFREAFDPASQTFSSPSGPGRYQGHCTLALARLSRKLAAAAGVDTRECLAAARRGAQYIVLSGVPEYGEAGPPHDPWLMLALEEVCSAFPQRLYSDYCFQAAEAIASRQYRAASAKYEGYVGGSPAATPPTVSATAEDCRSLLVAWRLARRLHVPSQKYRDAISRAATFVMRLQYRPACTYFLRNPDGALGAFRKSITNDSTRMHYMQQCICALLDARELFRPRADVHQAKRD